MSDVTYYDVEAMIRDACAEVSGELDRLRSHVLELSQRVDELREQNASLTRVLQSRTEHLV